MPIRRRSAWTNHRSPWSGRCRTRSGPATGLHSVQRWRQCDSSSWFPSLGLSRTSLYESEQGIERECKHHDDKGPGEHLAVIADGDAVDQIAPESAQADVGRHGRGGDDLEDGGAYAADDQVERERDLDPEQDLPLGHPDGPSRIDGRPVDGLEP